MLGTGRIPFAVDYLYATMTGARVQLDALPMRREQEATGHVEKL